MGKNELKELIAWHLADERDIDLIMEAVEKYTDKAAPVDEDELWQEVVDLINDYDRDAVFSLPLLLVKSKFSITRKQ